MSVSLLFGRLARSTRRVPPRGRRPTSGREEEVAEVGSPALQASLQAVVEGSLAREAWPLAVVEGFLAVLPGRAEEEEPLEPPSGRGRAEEEEPLAAVASDRAAVERPLAVSLAAGSVTKAIVAEVEVPAGAVGVAGAGTQG